MTFEEIKLAAERGDVRAQCGLGTLYALGEGVPQGYIKAALWFYRAANQGDAKAQFNLGVLYAHGWGVLRNRVIAYALYNVAAKTDPDGEIYRVNLEKQMTPIEISAAQALAVELAKPGNLLEALYDWRAHAENGE